MAGTVIMPKCSVNLINYIAHDMVCRGQIAKSSAKSIELR